MSHQKPVQQTDRAACEVGDFVLASSVPEWATTMVFQIFLPHPAPVPTVRVGEKPTKVPPLERWVFRGSFYLDAAGDSVEIWRRES